MRALFASTRGAGHFGPLAPLARACADAGHAVLVAAPPDLREAIAAAGLEHWELADPPADELGAVWERVPTLSPDEANEVVIRDIFGRLNTAATLPGHLRAIREWGADLVVRESNEYGSALAAELAGVPHAHFSIGLASVEELALDLARPALVEARAAAGLPEDPDLASLRGEPSLTWFPQALDGASRHPDTLRLRDPAWDEVPGAPPADWWDQDLAELPLVYVTFGSVAGSFEQARPVFAMAMAAVEPLAVRVLLTVGRSVDLGTLPPSPPNVHVEHWVAQGDVLHHCVAVVCHAGAGSTLGALAAARPVVAVPLFADQPFNAERIAQTGAGLSVGPDPESVRSALQQVLSVTSYAEAAARIAGEMRSHLPVRRAVARLAALE